MPDEANRTGGLFMPYPLLGLLLTLVLALGGGIAGLFIQVNSLQTTILLRDIDYQRQLKEQKDKQDQMEIYMHNDRERLAVLEYDSKQPRKRN